MYPIYLLENNVTKGQSILWASIF